MQNKPKYKIGEEIYFVEIGSYDSGDPDNINFAKVKRLITEGFYPHQKDEKFYLICGDYQYPKTMCFTKEEAKQKVEEFLNAK